MRGVTLIELLICSLVLAILVALAVPAYRVSVLRAQRSEARGALLQVLVNEERFFLEHGRYTADLSGAPAAGGLGLRDLSEAGRYALDARLVGANGNGNGDAGAAYVASATPLGAQREDLRCSRFSIDERGTRSASGSDPQASINCWR